MGIFNYFKERVALPISIDSAVSSLIKVGDDLQEILLEKASSIQFIEKEISEKLSVVDRHKADMERASRIQKKLLDILK
jgi:hypothetical protein